MRDIHWGAHLFSVLTHKQQTALREKQDDKTRQDKEASKGVSGARSEERVKRVKRKEADQGLELADGTSHCSLTHALPHQSPSSMP